MSPEKRYTEAEARAIFERAAKRHEEALRAEEASRAGLTLEELQRIGAESGIDPQHVAAAASANLKTPVAPEELKTFLGVPSSYRVSRTIPVEIDDRTWEQIVRELRNTLGNKGIPGQYGGARTWQISDYGSFPCTITTIPEESGTRIEIEEDHEYTKSFLFLIPALFAITGLAPLLAGRLEIGFALVWAALGVIWFAGSWAGMRVHFSKRKRKFKELLNRIELIARRRRMGKSETTSETKSRPQIDLDALPDEPIDERAGSEKERRRSR